ncbi:MFS transporter [Sphaerulina musiva SO2202]|uniref:MFS transporter n=1 Tax=Sphaerulina musiva (strain SO2202) TaxID=692275 RepID=N1QMD6_SPHMS|nr:MFS transporter [Sphaerulina musiva SO2202]EMF17083.1 MFS transporter [Sphaerulina musiva SO2202]
MDDESTTTTATKRPRFFPTLTATRLQIATYLLGIALFSIAFLVFVNSSISFVVTDIIGQKEGVGDAVGTLGFADECLALVACPLWGLLSDRIGVRTVAVLGYSIVAISLACLVQSTNVFPDLLMGRLGFSLGAAACTTMVTAVLPSMVMPASAAEDEDALSTKGGSSAGTSQLAGLVGFFTGAGALVALSIFLPLPAHLQQDGFGPSESVQVSYYIVAVVALCVAVCIFVGLRNLPGEEKKSISGLFRAPYDETTTTGPEGHPHITLTPQPSYVLLAKESLKLGFTDPAIGLGYLGGFVARASSVGISLFIPLFVNAYFVRTGLCTSNPDNLTDIKRNCQRAYKLAAALTGIGELAALICAPLFGWAGGRAARSQSEWPLLAATALGVVGYVSFGLLRNPDPFHVGGQWAIISVILVGMSQIGAIVCSLALLGRGVNQATSRTCRPIARDLLQNESTTEEEGAPLLQEVSRSGSPPTFDRARLSGSIAGMYSFAGGAGILILTKVGGLLFDKWHTGAPFFLMAIFNAILLVAIVVIRGGSLLHKHRVAV